MRQFLRSKLRPSMTPSCYCRTAFTAEISYWLAPSSELWSGLTQSGSIQKEFKDVD